MEKLETEDGYETWYFNHFTPKDNKYLDEDVYILYDINKKIVNSFDCFAEMLNYIYNLEGN